MGTIAGYHAQNGKPGGEVRLVLGSIGSAPIIIRKALQVIEESGLTDASVERAALTARSELGAVTNLFTSAGYKRQLAEVLVKRALEALRDMTTKEQESMMEKKIISFTVNETAYEVAVKPWQTLLDVIRDELGLTGTKRGSEIGTCGVCTVIIDGRAILSCLTLAVECEGQSITTIEGISTAESLHPVQKSFRKRPIQCGYCTPGIIMTSKALLDENPSPSDDEIKEALAGTFCRCTDHIKIMEATYLCRSNFSIICPSRALPLTPSRRR